MLDYLRKANKILIFLFLLFFISSCFAKSDIISNNKRHYSKEEMSIEKIYYDVYHYIVTHDFCFVVDDNCKNLTKVNLYRIENIVKENGYEEIEYLLKIKLVKERGVINVKVELQLESKKNSLLVYVLHWDVKKIKRIKINYV